MECDGAPAREQMLDDRRLRTHLGSANARRTDQEGSRCARFDCLSCRVRQCSLLSRQSFTNEALSQPHFRHVGDGNFHSLILFNGADELEKTREAVHEMVYAAQRLDGTATGEHGVGLGKVEVRFESSITLSLLD